MQIDEKALETAIAIGQSQGIRDERSTDERIAAGIRAYLSTVTPAEVGGLVERLEYRVGNPSAWDSYDEGASELIREAATALTTERAAHAETMRERDELKTDIASYTEAASNLATELFKAEARLAEALKALEPFHHLANAVFYVDEDGREMNAGKPDDASLYGFDRVNITYGDLRAARRALTGGKEDG